jgi:hypothetical protein
MASLETQVKDLIAKLFKKTPRRANRQDPFHDWKKIIIGFVIALLIVVLVDGYIFYKVNKGELFSFGNNEEVSSPTLNQATLDRTNKRYDDKQAALEQLKTSTEVSIDPSR